MAYIIHQTSGKFYNQACEYTRIRISAGIQAAIEYFCQVMDNDPKHCPDYLKSRIAGDYSLGDVWWIYNADSVLKSASRCPKLDYSKFTYHDSEYKAKAICHELTRLVGGSWSYYYEY